MSRTHVTLLAAALSTCLCGCAPPAMTPPPTTRPTTQPSEQRDADDGPIQPADAVSREDLAVLDATLSHFAADPRFEAGHRLVVHTATLGGSAFVRRDQVRSDSGEGDLPEDALVDIERRNNGPEVEVSGMRFSSVRRAGAPLAGWSPAGPNVTLDDLDRFEKGQSFERRFAFDEAFAEAHPDAKAYAWASLPGYSADGRRAVVRVAFGPSAHGAFATYVLAKDAAGAWAVTWRTFCYYA